jgi:ATP-dependent Clp protease adapter protein ClpS
MSPLIRLLSLVSILLPNAVLVVTSFSASTQLLQNRASSQKMATLILHGSSTVEAPVRPDTDTDIGTDRKSRRGGTDSDDDTRRRRSNEKDDRGDDNTNDFEYYIDPSVSREMNEPFHILLMGSATYVQPKVTVSYVSATLEYVLGMPHTDAYELSLFAHDHDMSCLGTWTREQCLAYGKQLQSRDVICRVVPYCLGGQRGWQAKDTSSSFSKNAEQ